MNKIVNILNVDGQSNAMNFGTAGLPFPGGWTVDNGIQIWNGTNACADYDPLVNGNGDSGGGVWGPEAEYCRQLRLLRPAEPIVIVKHAIGNTGVAQKPVGTDDWSVWSGKEWTNMYNSLVSCCEYFLNNNQLPVVTTTLGCFGETDTKLQADADAFLYNMQAWLTALRERVQCHNMRAVLMRPFPNSTQGPGLATVRSAVQTIGGYYRNAWVNTDDLTPTVTPNDGHLIPTSVVTLGARMFAADMAISP